MIELKFPMFSRFSKQMNGNVFYDSIIDEDFIVPFDMGTPNSDNTEFIPIPDCDIRYFVPNLPKTCEYQNLVPLEDWMMSYPTLGAGHFKVIFLRNCIYMGVMGPRFFYISYRCDDCDNIHNAASEIVEILHRFHFQTVERRTATGLENFPDELAYSCLPEEVLETNKDYSIENGLIRMLEEDIASEEWRSHMKRSEQDTQMEVEEEASDQTPWKIDPKIASKNYFVHMMRCYTLQEHIEFIFGKTKDTAEMMKQKFADSLAISEHTDMARQALIEHTDPVMQRGAYEQLMILNGIMK